LSSIVEKSLVADETTVTVEAGFAIISATEELAFS